MKRFFPRSGWLFLAASIVYICYLGSNIHIPDDFPFANVFNSIPFGGPIFAILVTAGIIGLFWLVLEGSARYDRWRDDL